LYRNVDFGRVAAVPYADLCDGIERFEQQAFGNLDAWLGQINACPPAMPSAAAPHPSMDPMQNRLRMRAVSCPERYHALQFHPAVVPSPSLERSYSMSSHAVPDMEEDSDGYATVTDDEAAPAPAPVATPARVEPAPVVAAPSPVAQARRRAKSSPFPLAQSSPSSGPETPRPSWQRRKRISELPPAQQRRAREMNREAARRNREMARRERDLSGRRLQTLETLNSQLRNILARERKDFESLMTKVVSKLKTAPISWLAVKN